MQRRETETTRRAPRALVLTASHYRELTAALCADEREAFAVLFCAPSTTARRVRWLVREVWIAPDAAYRVRDTNRLEIAPAYVNAVISHAADGGWHPVLVHSHPDGGAAYFSGADDAGDGRLLPVFASLLPAPGAASAVITATDMVVRTIGPHSAASADAPGPAPFEMFDTVDLVGSAMRRLGGPAVMTVDDATKTILDRQVRAVGVRGQHRLRSLRVAIVGSGGTGSAVGEQLVRSGLRDFLLVDPDTFAPSNWARVWGSTMTDVITTPRKVDLQAAHLRRVHPDVHVEALADSVVNETVLRALRDCDVVFGCTDNFLSRAMLNRFAHQHLVPVIDMGIRLDARAGTVTAASGRVSVVGPGLSCLRCGGHLNAGRLHAEALAPAERRRQAADGYTMGVTDAAPSVISLNTTVASLAVTACLAMFTDLTGAPPATTVIYDATRCQLFSVEPRHEPTCDICGAGGIVALGDRQRVSAFDTHRLV